jgi:hypothetical protein
MRLGVGEPPEEVGWGVGPSWSDASSCNPVSAIWPIPLRFPAGHPFLLPIPKALYTHWWPPTIGGDGQQASGGGGTAPRGGVGGGAELECGVLV